MIPLADDPKVVIRIDENGLVAEVSTNIAPEVKVTVVHSKPVYDIESQAYKLKEN